MESTDHLSTTQDSEVDVHVPNPDASPDNESTSNDDTTVNNVTPREEETHRERNVPDNSTQLIISQTAVFGNDHNTQDCNRGLPQAEVRSDSGQDRPSWENNNH